MLFMYAKFIGTGVLTGLEEKVIKFLVERKRLMMYPQTTDALRRRDLKIKVSSISSESQQLIQSRKMLISNIETIIDELNKLENDVRISKVTGSVAGVVGSGLAIVGVAGAFFTFGSSLALTAVGAGVGVAGGVTGIGAAIAHSVVTKNKLKEIKDLLDDDASALNKLAEEISGLASMGGVGGILAVRLFDALGDFGSGACRTATMASRGFMAVSGVLAVITLPIDFYTIISNSIDIHKGEEHESVKKLRQIIRMLENTIQKLESIKEKAYKHF